MKRVKKIVRCHRTLELINNALSAGYFDPQTGALHRDNVGTPQGSVLSPLLCNIVLHELDNYLDKLSVQF